jgi:putative Mg2+ transporter-C (MgtC) family protein
MDLGINSYLLPLLAAAVTGCLVGLERQFHGHWAGFRTHMMVSIGSAMFVLGALGALGESQADVSRVIQGIAAGIGFIGAGTILKLEPKIEVKGLTTASTIWVASAVGTCCGLQNYPLAVWSTIICLVVLVLLRPIEKRYQHVSN